MEDAAGRVVHLIELVDAADAVIGQDQGPRLQDELSGVGVFGDVGRQTDGRGALSRRILTSRHQVVHVLEQLRLRGT